MKTNTKRRGAKRKTNRVDDLAKSILKHIHELKKNIEDLGDEADQAAERGCTRKEEEAIEFAYLSTPIQLLLLTATTVIDSLPEDSGIDHGRITGIIDTHTRSGRLPHQLAKELLGLLGECYAYIDKEVGKAPQEGNGKTPSVH